MTHQPEAQPDYGTGQKKLSIYIFGIVACAVLTLISFWAVMSHQFAKAETFAIIYSSAIVQFIVQLLCFLRLNTATHQSRMNVMAIVFTLVILITIVCGSLWIMYNLNYNMTS